MSALKCRTDLTAGAPNRIQANTMMTEVSMNWMLFDTDAEIQGNAPWLIPRNATGIAIEVTTIATRISDRVVSLCSVVRFVAPRTVNPSDSIRRFSVGESVPLGSNRTIAREVAKFTSAWMTPGTVRITRSMRDAHAAHDMPPTSNVSEISCCACVICHAAFSTRASKPAARTAFTAASSGAAVSWMTMA